MGYRNEQEGYKKSVVNVINVIKKMKKLNLKNTNYQYLENSFKQWLEALGYADSTVYNLPNHLREFLSYLEKQNINKIDQVKKQHIDQYLSNLSKRKNQRLSGGLSIAYINKHIQALRNFSIFLRESRQIILAVETTNNKAFEKTIKVLTKKEIQKLYDLCDTNELGQRDKVMLDIYYACGLRRNEAVQLDLSDIITGKGLVYVRKTKNYKERYVPINKHVAGNLLNYIKQARTKLITADNLKETAFFISIKGNRLNGQSLAIRLKRLVNKAGLDKNTGLHTLRHTIATHLLQSGMKLEDIARFLGHSSLESTQIYTHLGNEL